MRFRAFLNKFSVIFSLLMCNSVFATDFTYTNLLLESFKLNNQKEITKDISEDWFKLTDRDNYLNYKNDEFEFDEKLSQAGKDLEKQLNKSEDTVFTVKIKGTAFGEYDFDKNQFSYTPLDESGYLSERDYTNFKYFPREIKVSISNPEIINGIPMEKSKAKEFLNQRKDKTFKTINRQVYLNLKLKMIKANSLDELVGTIISYQIEDLRKGSPILYEYK